MFLDPVIGFQIKSPDKFHGIGLGSFCFLRVCGRVALCHLHLFPHFLQNGLIQDFNAPKSFPLTVSLGEAFQHSQLELHFLRLLGPFAHAADPAVVKTVLAVRRCMEINEHLQSIALCPGKSLVQLLHASDKRRAVAEDEIGDRNSDRVHSHCFDSGEIPFCDIF